MTIKKLKRRRIPASRRKIRVDFRHVKEKRGSRGFYYKGGQESRAMGEEFLKLPKSVQIAMLFNPANESGPEDLEDDLLWRDTMPFHGDQT